MSFLKIFTFVIAGINSCGEALGELVAEGRGFLGSESEGLGLLATGGREDQRQPELPLEPAPEEGEKTLGGVLGG